MRGFNNLTGESEGKLMNIIFDAARDNYNREPRIVSGFHVRFLHVGGDEYIVFVELPSNPVGHKTVATAIVDQFDS